MKNKKDIPLAKIPITEKPQTVTPEIHAYCPERKKLL